MWFGNVLLFTIALLCAPEWHLINNRMTKPFLLYGRIINIYHQWNLLLISNFPSHSICEIIQVTHNRWIYPIQTIRSFLIHCINCVVIISFVEIMEFKSFGINWTTEPIEFSAVIKLYFVLTKNRYHLLLPWKYIHELVWIAKKKCFYACSWMCGSAFQY